MVDKIRLEFGDCLEVMQQLADEHITVDLVLCDMPYGTTSCKWDQVLDLQKVWELLNKITKPNAAICLFGSEPFSSVLRLSNIKHYKYDLYWEKEKPTNFFQLKRRFGKVTENICVFYKHQATYNPQMVKHNGLLVHNNPKPKIHNSITTGVSKNPIKPYDDTGYRYPKDILKFNRVKLGQYLHPTQKPIDLLTYLIKSFSDENDTVLDFTMGSGSTGVACIHTNRKFIGIDNHKEYFDIAYDRIQRELVD